MASSNSLQLVIDVDSQGANASIRSVNSSFNSMENAAVSAGNHASHGLGQIEESLSGAVLKGNILTETFEKIGDLVKDATVESAMYAARTEQLGAALQAVVKGNNLNAAAVQQQVEGVKALGVTTQVATEAVTKLIAANIDYTKATQLATAAADLGHVNGRGTAETMEALTRSIIGANDQLAEHAGLMVQYGNSYKDATKGMQGGAEALSAYQKAQIRLNVVLQAAASYHGINAASMDSASGQLQLLKMHIDEARNTIGNLLLPVMIELVKHLTDMAEWVQKNGDEVKDLGEAFGIAAAAIAAAKIPALLGEIREGLMGIRAALLAAEAVTPWGLIVAGATLAGGAIAMTLQQTREGIDAVNKKSQDVAKQQQALQLAAKGMSLPDIVKSMKDEGINNIEDLKQLMNVKASQSQIDQANRVYLTNRENKAKSEADAAAALEAQKKLADERVKVEENAAQALLEIGRKDYNQFYKDVDDIFEKLNKAIRDKALSAKASADYMHAILGYHDKAGQKVPGMLEQDDRKEMAAWLKAHADDAAKANEQQGKLLQDQLKYAGDIQQQGIDNIGKQYDFEQAKIDQTHQLQIDALDSLSAKTVDEKLAVEQKKLDIEKKYLAESQELQLSRLRSNAELERSNARAALDTTVNQAAGNPSILDQANQNYSDQIDIIGSNLELATKSAKMKTATSAQEAQDQAVKSQTQVYQDQYKSTYDAILKQTDGFFDALSGKSKNAWKSMADDLKETFTKALRDMITSKIAQYFMQLITGQPIQGSGKNGDVISGVEMGGASGMGAIGGRSSGLASLGMLLGLPGLAGAHATGSIATPPFLGTAMHLVGSPSETRAVESIPYTPPAAASNSDVLQRVEELSRQTSAQTVATPAIVPDMEQAPSYSSSLPTLGNSGNLMDLLGSNAAGQIGPGGTAPFVGSDEASQKSSMSGLMSLGKLFGGTSGGLAGLAGLTAGGLMFLQGLAGNNGLGGTINQIGGGAMLGYGVGKMFGPAFGPVGAEVGAGVGVVANGVKRHSVGGMLESTAGGALAGAELGSFLPGIGTALGAGIGAIAGGIAGLIGMLTKSPEQQVIDQVKQAYGITLDKGTAKAIYQIAQQQFGGAIHLAIQSKQIREMLSLYAQATGQNFAGISPRPVSYTAMEANGSIYNVPTTTDGQIVTNYGGSLPSLSGSQMRMAPGGLGGGNVTLSLDGASSAAFLQGQTVNAIAANPGAVSTASMNGQNASVARRETQAQTWQPGLVTR